MYITITTLTIARDTADTLLSWCTRQKIAACYTGIPGSRLVSFMVEEHNRNRVTAKVDQIERGFAFRLITWT